MAEKFSLKDHLFNKTKVNKIADEIKSVYPNFDHKNFVQKTLEAFPNLELKARIAHISDMLRQFLHQDFRKAAKTLIAALPAENDPNKSDDDFGDFIYAPYSDFIAKFGATKDDLHFSLSALKEITKRFSAEDSMRTFINKFPAETLNVLLQWSKDANYHVRRLTSESTRPKLPWSPKINIDVTDPIGILNNLFSDKTRFVTRSVANHLNDIAKVQPELTISTLKSWIKLGKQTEKEMAFIINHAMRTLIKKGHTDAMTLLGFSSKPAVKVTPIKLENTTVHVGKSLRFSFDVVTLKDERILVDYIIHFCNKRGKPDNKKVFKLKRLDLKARQLVTISKNHPMRANMTTRKLYPGKHKLLLQINGDVVQTVHFDLVG